MYFSEFLIIAFAHLIAVISPGPDFVVVCKQSLVYSKKSGVYTALGLGLGILVHVFYCLVGIGLIISQSIILFNIIKFAGAGYLIYIGLKSLLSKHSKLSVSIDEDKNKKDISVFSAIKTGFLTNVLNPKATLFILALFTQVINPHTPLVIQAFYGAWMGFATFAWFALVATALNIGVVRNKFLTFSKYIEKVTGVVLVFLGLKIIFEKH